MRSRVNLIHLVHSLMPLISDKLTGTAPPRAHAIEANSPNPIDDMHHLEMAQRRATRLVKGLCFVPYGKKASPTQRLHPFTKISETGLA